MAFNGSGTYALLYNFVTEAASAPIEISKLKAEFDGIATGLSTCIARDGQSTVSANIPFNNKRITGLADASADTDALNRQSADSRYGYPVVKVKTADETVNNSDTLQDDDHITGIALTAGSYYEVNGIFQMTGGDTPDSKFALTFTNAPQLFALGIQSMFTAGGAGSAGQTAGTAVRVNTSTGAIIVLRVSGMFLANASTGGTCKLQWAQYLADPSDTVLKKGSFLRVTKLT